MLNLYSFMITIGALFVILSSLLIIGYITYHCFYVPRFSHQFFPTPLTSTPNSTSLPLLANGHSTVYPPSIQLPTFWKFNVAGYFSTIELIFQENNITTERSKYCLLIQSLSYTTDVLQKVANVTKTIDTLCHHPYTILKNALSQQYSSPTSPATCLQTLLNQCHRS